MSPPPETIVFSDSIQWLGHSLTNGNQREYNDNISSSLVTNNELVSNLALGQSVACQIKINGKVEILPLFLAERSTTQSGTIQTIKSIAKGANVLDDGHIAGVISFLYLFFFLDKTPSAEILGQIQYDICSSTSYVINYLRHPSRLTSFCYSSVCGWLDRFYCSRRSFYYIFIAQALWNLRHSRRFSDYKKVPGSIGAGDFMLSRGFTCWP